jgi:hypothetical protein
MQVKVVLAADVRGGDDQAQDIYQRLEFRSVGALCGAGSTHLTSNRLVTRRLHPIVGPEVAKLP